VEQANKQQRQKRAANPQTEPETEPEPREKSCENLAKQKSGKWSLSPLKNNGA
jgi:hypothetical protein